MSKKIDNVNKPKHYTSDPSGIECIDIVRHRNFNIGNAIKYLWRQGIKNESNKTVLDKQIEDLNKAVWYIVDEIHKLGGRCTVKTDSINTCLPIDNESIIEAAMNFSKFVNGKRVTILGLCNNNETIKMNIKHNLSSILLDLANTIETNGQIKLNT